MIYKIISFVEGVNWQVIGAQVFIVVTTVTSAIIWFRKNIVNVKDLMMDGKVVSEEVKYRKAQIKSQNNLIGELSQYKRTVDTHIRNTKVLNEDVTMLVGAVSDLTKQVIELTDKIKELEGTNNEL